MDTPRDVEMIIKFLRRVESLFVNIFHDFDSFVLHFDFDLVRFIFSLYSDNIFALFWEIVLALLLSRNIIEKVYFDQWWFFFCFC